MANEPEIENLAQLIEFRMLQGWQYFITGSLCGDAFEVATAIFEGKKIHSFQKNS